MGTKTCGSCHGRGSHTRYEAVNSANPWVHYNQREDICTGCGGSGRIFVPDPPVKIVPPRPRPSMPIKVNDPKLLGTINEDPVVHTAKSTTGFKMLFGVIGAFIGYSLTPPLDDAGTYVVVGAILGYLFLPVFIFLAKLAFFALVVFMILVVGYLILSGVFGF